MRRWRLAVLTLWVMLSGVSLSAETVPEPTDSAQVAKAIAALDATRLDERWHFTMLIEHEGTQQIVRNNPHAAPEMRRQLVSVDGSTPSDKALSEFRSSEQKRVEEEADSQQGFGTLVDVSTLNLLEVSDEFTEYAFVPRISKLENAADKLRGILRLNRQRQYVESIRIFNVETFSPAFSVSLETFLLQFHFSMQAGSNLLTRTENQTRGKVAFVKMFDSSTRIEFSDYRAIEE